jgi:hypothetical protein
MSITIAFNVDGGTHIDLPVVNLERVDLIIILFNFI